MDGFELAERIRSNPEFTCFNIMMLTSGELHGDICRCEKLGITAHLVKPIRAAELLKAILQALPADRQATRRLAERTEQPEIHAGQHCLSHPAEGRGRLVLQGANSHRVPSRSCRRDPRSASARRPRAGPTVRPGRPASSARW